MMQSQYPQRLPRGEAKINCFKKLTTGQQSTDWMSSEARSINKIKKIGKLKRKSTKSEKKYTPLKNSMNKFRMNLKTPLQDIKMKKIQAAH